MIFGEGEWKLGQEKMDREKVPWWLWPNLLSLDAPMVAVGWAWLFSKAWGVVSLPWELWVTLGVAVWIVYVLDRLGDVGRKVDGVRLEKRHWFHERHRKVFLGLVGLGVVWCGYAILVSLGMVVLWYGAFVMMGVFGYFVAMRRARGPGEMRLVKNTIASLTFAYGTAAGVHAYAPVFQFGHMVFSVEVILFAALCLVNMTAIDFFHLKGEDDEDAAAVLSMGTLILGGVAMYVFMSTLSRDSFFFKESFYNEQLFYHPFAIGVLVGAAGFFLLNQSRRKMAGEFYRVMVDVVVLVPVLVYLVLVRLDGNPLT